MMITNDKKWLLVGAALIILALLKGAMLLWWESRQPIHQTAKSCQITQSGCPFGQGANLQLVGVGDNKTPFHIRATGVAPNTQQMTASFRMVDMDMGFNRFVLNKQADGTWLAENVHLPLCTQSRHDWLIQWQVDDQHFQAAFQTK